MNRLIFVFPAIALISIHCIAQSKLRKLPSNINHPAINVSAPYVSLDGNSLVFISDNSDENQPTMFYTTKRDAVNWNDPVMIPRSVNNRLNFINGFALSADGKTLLLSSLKSGGLGGFDIVMSQLKGTIWSETTNLGLPINSIGHEACPSLSADGSALYFMRCEKMDQKSASGCKLFVSKKSRLGRWEEPVELPDYINTGNSQTPRILGDGETLIFSSDQFPNNKGDMDLYMTRIENDQWSKPVTLDFANTSIRDQYVSAASLGRYLLKDQPGARTTEIVEILFPPDIKPKATIKIDGLVTGLQNLTSPYLAAFDLTHQQRVFSGRPDKNGAFTLFLKEGSVYDFSVEPELETYTFYSKIYDLTGDHIPQWDKIEPSVSEISSQTELELNIQFDPSSTKVSPFSVQEIKRVARMVKGNPNRSFALDVTLFGYLQDSVRSSPDLTEVIVDTLHFQVEKLIPDTQKIDSLLDVLNSLDSAESATTDSLQLIQQAAFRYELDSIKNNAFTTVMIDSTALKYTYHNDRTEAQGVQIVDLVMKETGSIKNLTFTHQALVEPENEKRKTRVMIRALN